MWAWKLSTVMPVQYVFQYVHELVLKYFFSSLIVSDLGFPFLSMFHSIAVKFILAYNKIWS
jgi:hypothetical protein